MATVGKHQSLSAAGATERGSLQAQRVAQREGFRHDGRPRGRLQASAASLAHLNHAVGAARILSASSAFLRAFSSLSLCRASFVLLSRPLLSRPFTAAGAGGLRPCASSFAAL